MRQGSSSVETGKMGIYNYTNASTYTLGDSDTCIISIEFTGKEETYAQFIGQVVVDVKDVPEQMCGAEWICIHPIL